MLAADRDRKVLELCESVECGAKRYRSDGTIKLEGCPLRRYAMRGDTADAVASLGSTPPDQLARLCLNSKPV